MSKSRNYGCIAPYSVSQNFLTSRRLIERLLYKTSITQKDVVLEIGAGKGHITKVLADQCRHVISYEIDRKLYEKLVPQLPPNVDLHGRDFLKSPLPNIPYQVFANIPFSKTTAIVRKLTAADNPPEHMWLIMEKGAAKRFCGLPKDQLTSLQIKPFFDTKIVYHFRREDFHPVPRVDVVMLEFTRKRAPDISLEQRQDYTAFLKHCFTNGLYGRAALMTKRQITTALRLAKLPSIPLSGEVRYIQWLCLFRCWKERGKKIY